MRLLRYLNEKFNFERPLLLELLSYANQSASCVIECVRQQALVVPPRLVGPTQHANLIDMGLKVKDQEQGVLDQRLLGVNERGTSVGGADTDLAEAVHTEDVIDTEVGPSNFTLIKKCLILMKKN